MVVRLDRVEMTAGEIPVGEQFFSRRRTLENDVLGANGKFFMSFLEMNTVLACHVGLWKRTYSRETLREGFRLLQDYPNQRTKKYRETPIFEVKIHLKKHKST
jgi:hypothetical protein